jgi:hypothetical protein
MRSDGLTAVLLSAILAAAGCQKRVPVAAFPPPAPPPVVAAPAPAPEPPPPPPPDPTPPPVVVSPLVHANQAFSAGNYEEAAKIYEEFLRTTPAGGKDRDEALFQLGLTYILRPAPSADWQRAALLLKQLSDEYPGSGLIAPANLILSLRSELDQSVADLKARDQRIKQLTTELDLLKKIDADRRKRP